MAMPKEFVPIPLSSLGVACAMRRPALGFVPLRSDDLTGAGALGLRLDFIVRLAGTGAGAGAGAGTTLGLRLDFNPVETAVRLQLLVLVAKDGLVATVFDSLLEMLPDFDFVDPESCRSTPASTLTASFVVSELGIAESLLGAASSVDLSHVAVFSMHVLPASTAFQKQSGLSLRMDLLSLDGRDDSTVDSLIREAWPRRSLAWARDANPLVCGPKETWEAPEGDPCPRKIPDSWVSTVGTAGVPSSRSIS
mmetsp:Transcript_18848/g.44658  ORF Transcript_18848/g.44658 Transcript_18848/m.44658 type:complete len:251 (+) Transcript_18848:724-1476(+)